MISLTLWNSSRWHIGSEGAFPCESSTSFWLTVVYLQFVERAGEWCLFLHSSLAWRACTIFGPVSRAVGILFLPRPYMKSKLILSLPWQRALLYFVPGSHNSVSFWLLLSCVLLLVVARWIDMISSWVEILFQSLERHCNEAWCSRIRIFLTANGESKTKTK